MSLTNHERAIRCQQAIDAYSDDDGYTNLVDFLADAMHWCDLKGHCFTDAIETAVVHFDAEATGPDILENLKLEPTNERSQSMTHPNTGQDDAQDKRLRSVTEEAMDAFWQVVVQHFPQAKTGDLSPLTTHHFNEAAKVAVEEWVWANVPSTTDE
jgi:hypothetical protein